MNKRDTDLLDMLPALEDGSLMYTPISICRDMVNLIPDDVFNKDAKFLDIACKSGRFLREIMYRLMESNQMQSGSAEGRDEKKYNLAIESERKEYIMREQLFGLSLNDTVVNIARRNLYGTLDSGIDNIITVKEYPEIAHKPKYVMGDTNIYKILKEKFNIMTFDVVIGNPPYNNDLYLDFVTFGHNLARKYDCWITPAKWQTKSGTKNEQFRSKIVPCMSKIVYYPDCIEVFGISDNSGITYYMIGKDECKIKYIENRAYFQPLINSIENRELTFNSTLWNIGEKIVNKVKQYNRYRLDIINEEDRKQYTICVGKQWCGSRVSSGAWDMKTSKIKDEYIGKGGCIFNPSGNIKVLGKVRGLNRNEYDTSGSSIYIFTSDNKDESLSFYSWLTSKLISFLILINLSGSIIFNDKTLKYIPDPGAFDHIFTDQELYEKYQLTDEEISIIESVIKERK